MDLECSNPSFDRHASCKNANLLGQNPNILNFLSCVPLAFFAQHVFELNNSTKEVILLT